MRGSLLTGLVARLRSLWRGLRGGAALGREVEAEFRFHVAARTADLERRGVPASAAARQARLEFGSADRYAEEARSARGLERWDVLRTDLRYAWRSLGRRPGFTAVAVLLLGLGVGVNAAVFSLVNATLLRPLPFVEPDRLVVLHQVLTEPGRAPRAVRWSYPEYRAVREVLETVSVAAYASTPLHISLGDGAVRTAGEFVSAAYFGTLGVQPAAGRWFAPAEDDVPGAHPVTVLSHGFWQEWFGGAADVLGRTVVVNGVALEVVGVARPGFGGLTGAAALWIPQAMAPLVAYEAQLTSPQQFHSVVGRLRAGVTLAGAQAELAAAGASAAAAASVREADSGVWAAALVPLDEARRTPEAVRARAALAGVALLVLLIAAVNLAALLLARTAGRTRELALRSALGAGRHRLLRHVLAEGVVIGALGGALGVLLAAALVRTLASAAAERLARAMPRVADLATFDTPGLDWRVVAFGGAIALASALLAALVPALRAARREPAIALNTGARGSTAGVGTLRRPTLLSAAAIAQVACALVLLSGAALLLDAFQRLRAVEPGFEPDGLVTLAIAGPFRETDAASAHALGAPLVEQVLERVQAVAGVAGATFSFCTPWMWCSSTPVYVDGTERGDAPVVGRHYVGPDHFRTLGIPILRGRALTAQDRPGAARVAVINETAARELWPGQDPIGQRVRFGSGGGFASPDSLTEIVGVAGDVVYGRPGDPVGPDFYTSYLQFTWARGILTVRAAGDHLALVPALRRAVQEAGVGLEVHDVRSMADRSREALAGERFAASAVTAFAALGLLLAALGVYGVMAYSVAQRRREMGIRIALGATRAGMLRLVLGQALALAAAGAALGLFGSALLGRTLGALMPQADSPEPLTLAAVALLLLAVCAVACALPARSASRVDPVDTLAAD